MKKHRVLVLVNREKDKNLLFTKEVVDFLSSKNIEVSNNSNVDIEEKENKDDSNLSKNDISNGSSL